MFEIFKLSLSSHVFSNDSEHVARLEEMLAAEKKKVRDLMDKLDQSAVHKSSGISSKSPPKAG